MAFGNRKIPTDSLLLRIKLAYVISSTCSLASWLHSLTMSQRHTRTCNLKYNLLSMSKRFVRHLLCVDFVRDTKTSSNVTSLPSCFGHRLCPSHRLPTASQNFIQHGLHVTNSQTPRSDAFPCLLKKHAESASQLVKRGADKSQILSMKAEANISFSPLGLALSLS